jgi:opacity protein-like surface antigen
MELFRNNGTQYSTWGFNVGVGYRKHLTGSLTGRAEVYYESMGKHEFFGNEKSTAMGLKIGLGLTPAAAPSGRRMRSDAMWPLAMGFQGGYSHVSTESGNEISGFSLPGSENAIVAAQLPLPGVAPIFVQIPLGQRFALEPSIGFSSVKVEGGNKNSAYNLGLRANYGFTRNLYAGVSYDYVGYSGDDLGALDATTGYGVQGGVRFPLLSGLTGRTEISFRKFSADAALLGDFTNTAISFGVSAPLK